MSKEITYSEKEKQFCEFIVSEYLKYGSVDEVFKNNDYSIPISYPGVHRLINKWGIVKAAGPNSKLSEALTFMVLLSDKKVPLERLYKSLPPSFKTSLSTLHRILHNIKEGVTRRVGTALVITSGEAKDRILIGEDISTPRIELGKPFGSVSLPMGYSKEEEEPSDSVLRVLQQEVFTKQTIAQNFPKELLRQTQEPFMYLDIADVRAAVYHLELPADLSSTENFFSYKIRNHRYASVKELTSGNLHLRTGIKEIALGYYKFITSPDLSYVKTPLYAKSLLNQEISNLALEYSM